jgi:phosphinothricin acetyltransferase
MTIKMAPASINDWPYIRRIYLEGIRSGHATFEKEENVTQDGAAWFSSKLDGLIFKAVDEVDEILGWAALSSVSDRCVYAGVAEVSVYVAGNARGRGVGSLLLAHLIEASEKAGIWTLQAGIFPENVSSLKLHEKLGFRTVGIREKLGELNNTWRDVAFLERRSDKI